MKILKVIFFMLVLTLSAPAFADLNVFACEPHWSALVQEIGGTHVTVTTATGAYNNPHYIQPKPSLIAAMRRADLVVCNGGDMEVGWLPPLLQQGGRDAVQPGQPGYLDASQFVQMLEVPATVDRAQGDIHPYGNPHYQSDPRTVAAAAPEVAKRMEQLDPANAAEYQKRYVDFKARFDAAIQKWQQEAAPLKGMKIIAYHDGWANMTAWLGLDVVGFLEPKPGIPPSPGHMAELLNQIKGEGVAGIIYSPYEDEQAPDWMAERAGIPKVMIADTVGADNDKDLFQFYEQVITQLLKLHGGGK
ncbi:MAG: metal ABC transporter substrate-binding protein [Bacillota bacterium]